MFDSTSYHKTEKQLENRTLLVGFKSTLCTMRCGSSTLKHSRRENLGRFYAQRRHPLAPQDIGDRYLKMLSQTYT